MKKVLIIESCENKIVENFSATSIAHVRNSIIIKDILKCDLLSYEEQIYDFLNNSYDVIICMYASGYMMYNKYMKIMDKNKDAKMFWFVNEYSLPDNILLRKWANKYDKQYNMIANIPRESYKKSLLNTHLGLRTLNEWINEWYVLDINCLIYNEKANKKLNYFCTEKEDCIYYGTFRPDRIKNMLDYNGYHYTISSSKKNHIEYKNSGIVAKFTNKLNWTKGRETLYEYKYSIYFEDNHTHNNYNFIANRFYECVMCDVLLFFDYRCQVTIEKCNYNIDNYMIVKNGEELKNKMNELDSNKDLYVELLEKQKSNIPLILKQKEIVSNQLIEILNK